MESTLAGRLSRPFPRWSLNLAVCAALLLPAFGPLLDHHLAERQPGHAHVYVGRAVPDHTHPYEVHHRHAHSGSANGNGGADGILYLTSHDGIGSGLTGATASLAQDSLGPLTPEDAPLQGRFHGDAPPDDAPIAPPWRPPRA